MVAAEISSVTASDRRGKQQESMKEHVTLHMETRSPVLVIPNSVCELGQVPSPFGLGSPSIKCKLFK